MDRTAESAGKHTSPEAGNARKEWEEERKEIEEANKDGKDHSP